MNTKAATEGVPFRLCRLIGQIRAEIVFDIEQTIMRQGIDLNFSQFLALKFLGAEKPMTPGELARLLHYNAGALTRMLDKLEQRGYLRRVPDPDDRRALRLELTPAGKAVRRRVMDCGESTSEKVWACTSERERKQVGVVLARVLEQLRNRE